MGKDLRGKELGVGISQQKDGLYVGRFVDRTGKRVTKRFKKLQECRQWISTAEFDDKHNNINALGDMTVKAWYLYWKDTKGSGLRFNTIKNYDNRFRLNIEPIIGNMLLSEVKPVHCQEVFNQMAKDRYKSSSIVQTKRLMRSVFGFAIDNEIIPSNPCKKSLRYVIGESSPKREALTIDQQHIFLKYAAETKYFDQFRFVLQTGIRCGELIGLKWEDIDFKHKTMNIQRTMSYVYELQEWKTGEPKTESGKRVIPLTDEAVNILSNHRKITSIKWNDYVFLNDKGEPILGNTYNTSLSYICKKAGLPKVSMHILRHTFATRCIEGGMKPKTLQVILGHSDVGTTMNLYVHTTEEEKAREIQMIQDVLNVI